MGRIRVIHSLRGELTEFACKIAYDEIENRLREIGAQLSNGQYDYENITVVLVMTYDIICNAAYLT